MNDPIKVVRFTKKYPPYNSGEIAGFPASIANKLIGVVAVEAEPEIVNGDVPSEIIQLKGGWYEVAGVKVQGRQAAMELYAELLEK